MTFMRHFLARRNFQIFWNWTHKRIPDRQQCVDFWKSKKTVVNHSTLLKNLPLVYVAGISWYFFDLKTFPLSLKLGYLVILSEKTFPHVSEARISCYTFRENLSPCLFRQDILVFFNSKTFHLVSLDRISWYTLRVKPSPCLFSL